MIETIPRSFAEAMDAYADFRSVQRSAEVGRIVALATAIELNRVRHSDVLAVVAEYGERMIRPGADGTPLVAEFLALELGPIEQVSPDQALGLIADVVNVKHRHPAMWAAFLEQKIRWGQAVVVARQCVTLSVDAAAEVDKKCAQALAMWPMSRLLHHLPAWIIAADPHTAAAKEAVARSGRRMDIGQIENGQCELFGRLAADDAIAFNQAITAIAADLPAPPLPPEISRFAPTPELRAKLDLNQRRAAAVGVLARQAFGQDVLPTHQLIVHINADDPALTDGDSSGAAQVEKWGTLLTSRLPEFLTGSRVIVRPVINPAALPAQDQHDPTEALRFAVCQRNPVDVYPYATRRSTSCDLDHTIAYDDDGPPGQTSPGNLGPLSRRAHRFKTHTSTHLCQPSPGTFHWTTPLGYEYVVAPWGTIALGRVAPDGRAPSPQLEPCDPVPDPPPDDPAWDQPPRPEPEAWTQARAALLHLAS